MNIDDYCVNLTTQYLGFDESGAPWEVVAQLGTIVARLIKTLGGDYKITDSVAVHTTARVEQTAQLKGPVIVGPNCFVGPHALIRNGAILTDTVSIGPACEVKCSVIGPGSTLGHFNFVGDSIIGSGVNLEAGAIVANHYNERKDKNVYVLIDDERIDTGVAKFGALIGDDSRLGANSVTSPGTLLKPRSIVGRLELIEQNPPA